MEIKNKYRSKIMLNLYQSGGSQQDLDEYAEQWKSTFLVVEFLLIGFLIINVFLDVPIIEKRGTSKIVATLIVVVMELIMRGFLIASAKEYLSQAQFAQRKTVRQLLEKGEIPDPDDYPLLRGIKLRGGEKKSYTFRIGATILFLFAIIFIAYNRNTGAGLEEEAKKEAAKKEIERRYEPQFKALKDEAISLGDVAQNNRNSKLMRLVQDSIRFSGSVWHKKELSEATAKLQVLRQSTASETSPEVAKRISALAKQKDDEIKNVKVSSGGGTTIFNMISSLLPLVFIPLIVWSQTYIVMTGEKRSVFVLIFISMFEKSKRIKNANVNEDVDFDFDTKPEAKPEVKNEVPNSVSNVEIEEKLTPKKLAEFIAENGLHLPSFDSVKSAKARGDEEKIKEITEAYQRVGVTIVFNGNYPHFSKKKGLVAMINGEKQKAKAK